MSESQDAAKAEPTFLAPSGGGELDSSPRIDAKKTPNLSKALLDAQRKAQPLAKDSKNNFHGYNYTSSEAMIDACRKLLHDEGIVVRRGSWAWHIVHEQEAVLDGRGGVVVDPVITANVQQSFILEHADSGEKVVEVVQYPAVTSKGRPMDKCVAGALTTAQNYWLRDQLMIPRIEEGQDNRDDRNFPTNQQQRQQSKGGQKKQQPQQQQGAPRQQQRQSGGGRRKSAEPVVVRESANKNKVSKDVIDKVEMGKYANGRKHSIETKSGVQYGCWDKDVAEKCQHFASQQGVEVFIEWVQDTYGYKMLNVAESGG